MKCQQCGKEAGDEQFCAECQEHCGSVQVLTPEERKKFSGVTLEQDNGYAGSEQSAGQRRADGVNIRYASFSSTKSGFLTKLAILAILLVFIFVALPLALLAMGAALLYWFLFKRR